MQSSNWKWHLDEVFVKINGERHYLWRAVDHEGEVLESYVTKKRDKKAALKFMKKAMQRYGSLNEIVTDKLGPTVQQQENWAVRKSRLLSDGQTTELKILTCRFEDGSGRWRGSGRCEASRSSPPPTRPSTTTSTMTAPSNAGLASNPSATQPSPSGVSSRLRDAAHPDF